MEYTTSKYFDCCANILDRMSQEKVKQSVHFDCDIFLKKIELYKNKIKFNLYKKYNEYEKILDSSLEETETNIKQLDIIRVLNEKYYNGDVIYYLKHINKLCYVSNSFYLQINIRFTINQILPQYWKTFILSTDIKNNIFNITSLISKLNYFYDNNIGYCCSSCKNIVRMYKRIADNEKRFEWLYYIWIAKNIIQHYNILIDEYKISLYPLINKLKLYIPDEYIFAQLI
jgi:hypothetical protein